MSIVAAQDAARELTLTLLSYMPGLYQLHWLCTQRAANRARAFSICTPEQPAMTPPCSARHLNSPHVHGPSHIFTSPPSPPVKQRIPLPALRAPLAPHESFSAALLLFSSTLFPLLPPFVHSISLPLGESLDNTTITVNAVSF